MNEQRTDLHILAIREARGMSQAQLAEATGLTQSSISRIERGGRELTLSNMRSIARALNCSVGELLGEGRPRRRTRRTGAPS
jgi:transcriptional regulator with XRE-family HTH domain